MGACTLQETVIIQTHALAACVQFSLCPPTGWLSREDISLQIPEGAGNVCLCLKKCPSPDRQVSLRDNIPRGNKGQARAGAEGQGRLCLKRLPQNPTSSSPGPAADSHGEGAGGYALELSAFVGRVKEEIWSLPTSGSPGASMPCISDQAEK